MGVNYAVREQKMTALCSDFAREFVARQFGKLAAEQIYAALPLYKRGKNKGQVKGFITWIKCIKGGWVRTGAYDHDAGRGCGHVMAQGTHDVKIVLENPAYAEKVYGLEAGQRRGLPTDANRETDEQWAIRCGRAIYQMQGLPVPAELAEPPAPELCHPKAGRPEEILSDAMKFIVLGLQRENRLLELQDPNSAATAAMILLGYDICPKEAK